MTWVERPPRILCAVAMARFAVVAVTFSDAGVPFPTWVFVSLFSLAIAVCWLIRLAITFIHSRQNQASLIRRNWKCWILTTALIVAGFVLAATLPLLSIRVRLSETALRESPALLSTVPQADLFERGRWIGLFHVKEFSQFGTELRFITNDCGVVDMCGIVFSPDGPPPNRGEDSFRHLFGPWWHWYQSW